MPLLEFMDGMLWDSWDKTRLVSLNPKKQGFGSLLDFIEEAHKGKALRGWGNC